MFRCFNLQIIIKEALSCTVVIVRRSGAGVLQKVLLMFIIHLSLCLLSVFPKKFIVFSIVMFQILCFVLLWLLQHGKVLCKFICESASLY